MKQFIKALSALALIVANLSAHAAPALMYNSIADTPPQLIAALVRTVAKNSSIDSNYTIAQDGCSMLKAQHLTGCFGAKGADFSAGTTRMSLTLTAWGRPGMIKPAQMRRGHPQANRIAYMGQGIEEWWRALPLGYEQGFTISRRPAGHGWVVLLLRASAKPTVIKDTIAWGNLRYGKLHVTDAHGKVLTAKLAATGKTIRLKLDTTSASFPITVDPLVWTQQRDIASDGAANDYFGWSVALSSDGSTALVGAPKKTVGVQSNHGEVYVFTNSSGVWSQTAELTASDGAAGDEFGWSVALSGDGTTALVGADAKSISGHGDQGAAYVFTNSSGTWQQIAELTASDGGTSDTFGHAAALSTDGNTALVTAYNIAIGSNTFLGAAYVFTKSGGSWSQSAELTASDESEFDGFGESAAISSDGTTVLVGSRYKTVSSNVGQGVVYVFSKPTDGWVTTSTADAILTASDGAANDNFGVSVALSDDGATSLIGAAWHLVGNNTSQGTAYVFTNSGGTWNQSAELTASDGTARDLFGVSVGISGDGTSALVGSNNKPVGVNASQGAVYLFSKPTSGWVTTASYSAEIIADDGAANDNFGASVALSDTGVTALVGVRNKKISNNTSQGAAYFVPMTNLSGVLNTPSQTTINSDFDSQYILTNNSTTASGDIRVQLPLPTSGAAYVSISSTQGTCGYDNTSKVATCDLGSIPGSGTMTSATLSLTATAAAGETISQSASLADMAKGSPTVDATAVTTVTDTRGGGALDLWSLLLLFTLVSLAKCRKAYDPVGL